MKLTRLPGKRRRFLGRFTLWLADDHLLAVEFNGYTESYKRYLFKDIQALTALRTKESTVVTVICAALAAVAAIPVLLLLLPPITRPTVWEWVTGALAFLFLVLLAINLLRGPTCVCHVRTALGLNELPSIRRLRHFSKVVERLRPLITTVQGPTAEPSAASNPGSGTASVKPVFQASLAGIPTGKLEGGYNGRMHMALFGLMIAGAAFSWFRHSHGDVLFGIANFVRLLALLCLICLALNRQGKFTVPKSMKAITWIALIAVSIEFIFGHIFMFAHPIFMKRLELLQDHQAVMLAFMRMRPQSNPFLSVVNLSDMILMSLCGLWGLAVLARWLRKTSGGPAAPASAAR